MICDVILGIDFWSRVKSLAFDFNTNEMILNDDCRIRLYHHPQEIGGRSEEEENSSYPVRTEGRCKLPGRTEGLVRCIVEGLQEGRE